ncbi:MAG TPA: DUF2723 domain-containing protein [Polyangiales bacterium]
MSTPPSALELASPRWATWLTGLSALAVYTFSAGGHSFWLDSAEFTVAAVQLDIPHPPGHPVAQLWAQPFTWLPIGPLPFRVAMAQAVAAALGAAALQVAFARTLRVAGVERANLRAPLSLGCVACLMLAYGYWFQAVRAEVYALQSLLISLALERLIALACDQGRDPRPLYAAAFYLGLGLANHHFMSVLMLPAALLGAWQTLRRHGPRVLAWCAACGGVGLFDYLYLPLRAASEPEMDLGHPVDAAGVWWVVSARVYARRIGSAATQPMDERFADLLVILAEQFTLLSLPLALIGLYAVVRQRRLWSIGYVWGLTALVCLCGRAWLNPVRNNPDVLGYMLPGFAGYLALAVCACLALLQALPGPRGFQLGQRALVLLGLALACLQLTFTLPEASLAAFRDTDAFDQLRQESLPAGATLFTTTPETAFRHWENRAVERARPDVDMVSTSFVNYGRVSDVLLARRPELSDSVRAFQRDGVLKPEALEGLVTRRPVLVELDLMSAWPLFDRVLPSGLLYRFAEQPPTRAQRLSAGAQRARGLALLEAELGSETTTETRRQLLWCHYIDAVYYAHHGETELALRSAAHGLRIAPGERELLALRELLRSHPQDFSLQRFVRAP